MSEISSEAVKALLADVAMEHARVQLGPDWYACTRCAGDRTARGHAEHVADIQAERLAALSPRVAPSAVAIRKAITDADDEFDRLDPDAEEDWGDWEARAVLALLASQPTIQSVRDQVSEEILAVAHDYRLPKRPDEEQTGFVMRLVRADVLSDAARIARGETKGGE